MRRKDAVIAEKAGSPYPEFINELLRPAGSNQPRVVDLFAGCGGLALGFEAQGMSTIGYEMEPDACASYRLNLEAPCVEGVLTPETELPACDILIGGPPCQPFSVGGLQLGLDDSRDGFPIFISAVERLQPKAWLFENVRGMMYKNREYLDQILNALGHLGYQVDVNLVNARDYGVPQNRERMIVVGHRGGFKLAPPPRTRFTAGDAIGDTAHRASSDSKFLNAAQDAYVARYEAASKCVRPRDIHLEDTCRTVTCRNLAGATGDMLRVRLPDGRRRRITVREAARLQSFPDWFSFQGGETSVFNQIGNAVPPLLSYHLAASVKDYLEGIAASPPAAIVPRRRPKQAPLNRP